MQQSSIDHSVISHYYKSVDKLIKTPLSIKQRFQEWYGEQIVQQKEDGSSIKPMADFPMQLMKSLGAKWIMEA